MLDLLIINFLILFLSVFSFDNPILITNIYKKIEYEDRNDDTHWLFFI